MFEYLTAEIKIVNDRDLMVFIPEEKKIYKFKSDEPKSSVKPNGEWVNINQLGEDNWELINTIPKHMSIIGIFKRSKQNQPNE